MKKMVGAIINVKNWNIYECKGYVNRKYQANGKSKRIRLKIEEL